MSFQLFSDTYIPRIETELKKALTFNFDDNRSILEEAVLYSATGNAKRIRALLSIASFRLFNSNIDKILPFAIAIEMVHSYSLIHDDLPSMDNDDLRRGQATCHVKFGEDIAILAGDSLNTFAFEYLSKELEQYYSADVILKVIQNFANACGIFGMAGGQVLDLKGSSERQCQDYLELTHQLKTGAILKLCVLIPAILECHDPKTQDTLEKLGQHIGLLFQITDDLLDVKENTETLGKTAKKDIDQNKLTYVSLWGIEEAERIANTVTEECMAYLNSLPKQFKFNELAHIIQFIANRNY